MSSQVIQEIAGGEGRTLNQLAKLFPPARLGKPVSLGCVLRWVCEGVRTSNGEVIRLEAARCSGRWLSSAAAVQRFIARQTPTTSNATLPTRTPTQRELAAERAGRQLEKMGI